jgi:hypothetical protein
MRWTKKPPAEDGWYWWRRDVARRGRVVRVAAGRVMHPSYGFGWADAQGGEWYGPLQEPGGDAVENCPGPPSAAVDAPPRAVG